jgi:hypothetical protein
VVQKKEKSMKQELPQCHPIAKYSPFLKFASLLIEATEKAYLTSLSPPVSFVASDRLCELIHTVIAAW